MDNNRTSNQPTPRSHHDQPDDEPTFETELTRWLKPLAALVPEGIQPQLSFLTSEPARRVYHQLAGVLPEGLRDDAAALLVWYRRAISHEREADSDDGETESDDQRSELLAESNHRMKNHIQRIVSLIRAKQRNDSDPAAVLKQAVQMLENFIVLNKTLGDRSQNDAVHADPYIRSITQSLHDSFAPETDRTAFQVQVDADRLPGETAAFVGLIINELVMNALQHGYDSDEEPSITISLEEMGEVVGLTIKDDGAGLPEAFSWDDTNGLSMVRALTEKQLNGSLRTLDTEVGAGWELEFPVQQSNSDEGS